MKIIPNILTCLFISTIFIQSLMAKQTITSKSTNFSSANDNFRLIEKSKPSNTAWINFITQNEKQKLESGIHLLDSIINYEYINVNDSVKKQKTIIEYDIPEKKTTTLNLRWDKGKMEWLKEGKIVETLNDDGNILSSERFLWDTIEQKWKSGLWYWSGHTRNKYNQNSQLVESIEYFNDKDIEGSIFNKTTWSYGDNNREILYLNYSITNNDSILKLSTEKSTLYEDNGMKKVIMYKNWDYELHAIVNSTKNITILDSFGNEVEFEYYVWDTTKMIGLRNQKPQNSTTLRTRPLKYLTKNGIH